MVTFQSDHPILTWLFSWALPLAPVVGWSVICGRSGLWDVKDRVEEICILKSSDTLEKPRYYIPFPAGLERKKKLGYVQAHPWMKMVGRYTLLRKHHGPWVITASFISRAVALTNKDCEAHAYWLSWHGDRGRPGRSLGMFKAVVELPDRNLKPINNNVVGWKGWYVGLHWKMARVRKYLCCYLHHQE